jgi:membrane dipeptidase
VDRRTCLTVLAGAPFAMAAAPSRSAFPNKRFRDAIIIDGLSGPSDPYAPTDPKLSARALTEWRTSGQTASSLTINHVGNDLDAFDKTVQTIAEIEQILADNTHAFLKISTPADLLVAKRIGKSGVIFNIQDTSLVGPELDRLKLLKGLGVRVVQLTYNNRNLSGDGCLEPANAGLSKLGRATIARLEQEKLLLDLSHGGQRTAAEAIAAATRPMTFSHTGCRALHDNPRNQWDAELKACADKGGVIGIYWMPFLVAGGKATGADVVRHMTHVKNICGEDHVAIGTDGSLYTTVLNDQERARQKEFFEDRSAKGIAAPGEGADIFNIVAEWDSHLRYRLLADGLARAGWSITSIEKALGVNLLRLYREVWPS